MQFDPISLAKFAKGKIILKPYSSRRTRIGVILSPKELGYTSTKNKSIHVQLGPISIVNWLSKNKIKSNQIPYGEELC
jgi:hypothetical protein